MFDLKKKIRNMMKVLAAHDATIHDVHLWSSQYQVRHLTGGQFAVRSSGVQVIRSSGCQVVMSCAGHQVSRSLGYQMRQCSCIVIRTSWMNSERII